MYSLTEHEVDMLAQSYGSIYQACFGIAFGGAVAILVTLFTVELTDRALGCFIAALVPALLLSLLFGSLTLAERGRVTSNVKRIKAR